MIEIIKPGTSIIVGGNIPAIVLSIQIHAGRIIYQVAWWHEGHHKTDWLEDFEISQQRNASARYRMP